MHIKHHIMRVGKDNLQFTCQKSVKTRVRSLALKEKKSKANWHGCPFVIQGWGDR